MKYHAPRHPDQPDTILTRCGKWRPDRVTLAKPGTRVTCTICARLTSTGQQPLRIVATRPASALSRSR